MISHMMVLLQDWLALPVTMLVYAVADALQKRWRWVILQPMLVSLVILIPWVLLMHVPVARYREATAPLVWIAGPLTVGMAIPLFRERGRILASARPLLLTLLFGSILASATAFGMAFLLKLGHAASLAFLTRAISLPFCLPVAHLLHAPVGLAAVIVGVSGVLGGVAAPWLLPQRWDPAARGVAMGLAAHGIGTAVALGINPRMGAYAALAMMLNGTITSLWLPWFWAHISVLLGF